MKLTVHTPEVAEAAREIRATARSPIRLEAPAALLLALLLVAAGLFAVAAALRSGKD